ncbi:MAG: hypothetical protein M3Z16_09785 [Pseudomonadota bacterium]|nr:hypothetical protein [Pseudomonadota bacterium]
MKPPVSSLHSRLETAIALARLFERVDNASSAPAPEQYQALVRQLSTALEAELPAPALRAILEAHPATAELYENLHYAESGLSQHALDRSVATEMLAAEAIHRASRGNAGPSGRTGD